MGIFDFLNQKGGVIASNIKGRNITITNQRIIVDGKVITDEAKGVIELRITEGSVENIETTCSVTVNGDVNGSIDAGMEVNCHDVTGNIDAGMSVTCRNVTGDVDAGMSVTCGDVGGDVDAGMSVSRR